MAREVLTAGGDGGDWVSEQRRVGKAWVRGPQQQDEFLRSRNFHGFDSSGAAVRIELVGTSRVSQI